MILLSLYVLRPPNNNEDEGNCYERERVCSSTMYAYVGKREMGKERVLIIESV